MKKKLLYITLLCSFWGTSYAQKQIDKKTLYKLVAQNAAKKLYPLIQAIYTKTIEVCLNKTKEALKKNQRESQKKCWHEKITQNPAEIVKNISHHWEKNLDFGFCQNLENLYKHIEKNEPLLGLYECGCEGNTENKKECCPLCRMCFPKIRKTYENVCVQTLSKQLNKKNTIHYVNFGSGQLLQDLIIISTILEKNPNAQIDISLIDQCYSTIKFSQENPNYIKNWDLKENYIKKYKEWLKNNIGKEMAYEQDTSNKDILDQFKAELFCYTKAQKTLKKALEKKHPNAKIKINLFYSTQKFSAWLTKSKQNYPDFITSADALHCSKEAKEEYIALCKSALEKNPDAQNIALYTEFEENNLEVNVKEIRLLKINKTTNNTFEEKTTVL